MDEFGLIAKYFRPLAAGAPGAFGLLDDAATLDVPGGHQLVVTADAVVESTHFLPDDPLDTVAQKALRVNLSDLAAKGARPVGYLLACAWRKGTEEYAIEAFANGLAKDQVAFGLPLLGGDTTVSESPATFVVTAFGLVPSGGMIKRAGAKPGDDIYVTGSIGDAGLGLRLLRQELRLPQQHAAYLIERYRIPSPRLSFMLAAREHVAAAIDVSDGLLADTGHIGEVSGCRIEIDAAHVPLSPAAQEALSRGASLGELVSAGDDYEVCFAARPEARSAIRAAAVATATEVTLIGRAKMGAGVALLAADGSEIKVARRGYSHF